MTRDFPPAAWRPGVTRCTSSRSTAPNWCSRISRMSVALNACCSARSADRSSGATPSPSAPFPERAGSPADAGAAPSGASSAAQAAPSRPAAAVSRPPQRRSPADKARRAGLAFRDSTAGRERTSIVRSALFVACLTAAACNRSAPAQPRFCDQDVAGLWLNSSDRHFAYRFREDGGAVTGEFLEREDDGGLNAPAAPVTFELKRTATTIEGVMRSSQETAGGRTCPVDYATRISDCKPQALQVVVEVSATVSEDCKRRSAEDGGPIPPDLREYRFERAP